MEKTREILSLTSIVSVFAGERHGENQNKLRMQAYIWLGPTATIDGGGSSATSSNRNLLLLTKNHNPSLWSYFYSYSLWPHHHVNTSIHRCGSSRGRPACSAGGVKGQNHYAVLGVSADASPSDIKKAYRLLALKYHPDVSKDAGAHETFKSIHLAYETLSNETTRKQYDLALQYHSESGRPLGGSWNYSPHYEDQLKIYRWAYLRRKMQREKYREHYRPNEKGYSFYDEDEEMCGEVSEDEERGSFTEVLQSALLTLFLMHTVGIRLSLTFSSLMAFLDQKLDGGYKIGYIIAWILGGSGGILLTLCLSFASWACGKTSSSLVALVVVAMWFGSNLARFVPLPQGALLTLLYMSIKLQVDLK